MKKVLEVIWLLPKVTRPEHLQRSHRKLKRQLKILCNNYNKGHPPTPPQLLQVSVVMGSREIGEEQVSGEGIARPRHGMSVLSAETWAGGCSSNSHKKITSC